MKEAYIGFGITKRLRSGFLILWLVMKNGKTMHVGTKIKNGLRGPLKV